MDKTVNATINKFRNENLNCDSSLSMKFGEIHKCISSPKASKSPEFDNVLPPGSALILVRFDFMFSKTKKICT